MRCPFKPVHFCSDLSDLRHWQKKGPSSEDPFNKFNKKLQVLTYVPRLRTETKYRCENIFDPCSYTSDEYVNTLTVPEWTKQVHLFISAFYARCRAPHYSARQETDELMKLIQRFDMNFFLIHDR
jgi:hypothetical protein